MPQVNWSFVGSGLCSRHWIFHFYVMFHSISQATNKSEKQNVSERLKLLLFTPQTIELLYKCHLIIPPGLHLVRDIILTMTQVIRMVPRSLTDLIRRTHVGMEPLLMKVQIYYYTTEPPPFYEYVMSHNYPTNFLLVMWHTIVGPVFLAYNAYYTMCWCQLFL